MHCVVYFELELIRKAGLPIFAGFPYTPPVKIVFRTMNLYRIHGTFAAYFSPRLTGGKAMPNPAQTRRMLQKRPRRRADGELMLVAG